MDLAPPPVQAPPTAHDLAVAGNGLLRPGSIRIRRPELLRAFPRRRQPSRRPPARAGHGRPAPEPRPLTGTPGGPPPSPRPRSAGRSLVRGPRPSPPHGPRQPLWPASPTSSLASASAQLPLRPEDQIRSAPAPASDLGLARRSSEKRSECEDPFDYVGSSSSWFRSSSKRDLSCRYR